MKLLTQWASRSHDRAVANARAATVDCSRRRIERAEVALFVEALAERREATRVNTRDTAVASASLAR